MDQDIKRVKAEEQQESLEEEVKDVKAGRVTIEAPVTPEAAPVVVPVEPAGKSANRSRSGKSSFGKKSRGAGRGRGRGDRSGEDQEFEQKIVDLARVTRVMAGGKRMRFRACVVIGDRKGRVAFGLAKGKDVTMAISKGVTQAKKDMITVPFVNETIPFAIEQKFKAARVLLRPAQKGKGIIAGGAVRIVLEMAGVPNVVAKILGTTNKVTNVKATMDALKQLAVMAPGQQKKTAKKEAASSVEPSRQQDQ
ncbi:30S ribosomal protein S5 [Candidatus Falkowbacteria bacterium]|nr:30S ribosomal protein S5 [Candidatus Falkowbacteria bacterium]